MALNRELQILLTLKDEASQALGKIDASLRGAEDASKKFGIALIGIATGAVAFGAKAIGAFQDSEKAEARLEQIAKQVTKATDEQIEGFKRLAGELQKVGVVEDDVVKAGQSQLASFTKSADVVSELTNDLADLAVAQYGVNVSQDQAIQTGNLLGKALQGQLGALTRTGILVSEDFKKAFEAANSEQERAVVISQIVQDNYGGLNEAMRATSAGGLQALKNDFGDLMEVIGAQLLPIFQMLIEKLNVFVADVLPAWIEKTKEIINFLREHQAVIYIIAGAIMAALLPAIYSMVAGFVAASVALAPFLIGGAIVGGIVAGIVWLVKNWDMLSEKVTEVFDTILQKVVGVLTTVKDFFVSVWTGISEFFSSIWATIASVLEFYITFSLGLFIMFLDWIFPRWREVFQGIADFFINIWTKIKEFYVAFINSFKTQFNSDWTAVKDLFTAIWTTMIDFVGAGMDKILNFIKNFTAPITNAFRSIWDAIANQATVAFENVKQTIKDAINWIVEKINTLIRAANSVAAKGAGALGITPFQIPEIPKLAKGGIVTGPTVAQIGEAGPEAVIPLDRAGGFGTTINITVNGDVSGDELVEKVKTSIMDTLRFNTKLAF